MCIGRFETVPEPQKKKGGKRAEPRDLTREIKMEGGESQVWGKRIFVSGKDFGVNRHECRSEKH